MLSGRCWVSSSGFFAGGSLAWPLKVVADTELGGLQVAHSFIQHSRRKSGLVRAVCSQAGTGEVKRHLQVSGEVSYWGLSNCCTQLRRAGTSLQRLEKRKAGVTEGLF